jgi:uncharacterized repeat protein (TIGR03837 family)
MRSSFLQTLGVTAPDKYTLCASLFCYGNAALCALIDAWSSSDCAVLCIVPAGDAPFTGLSSILGIKLRPGMQIVRGSLTITTIAFLDVDQYDCLLWACDINFVRGEDSFIRAQLAARPLVWQAYLQSDAAHLTKQAAFLDRYVEGLECRTAHALRAIHAAWNEQSPEIVQCWKNLMAERAGAAAHARNWADRIAHSGNLVNKLVEFCQDRLK